MDTREKVFKMSTESLVKLKNLGEKSGNFVSNIWQIPCIRPGRAFVRTCFVKFDVAMISIAGTFTCHLSSNKLTCYDFVQKELTKFPSAQGKLGITRSLQYRTHGIKGFAIQSQDTKT